MLIFFTWDGEIIYLGSRQFCGTSLLFRAFLFSISICMTMSFLHFFEVSQGLVVFYPGLALFFTSQVSVRLILIITSFLLVPF